MNPCFRNKFIKNGTILCKNVFELPVKYHICIYEVIRVIDGVALFLEDHLQRFNSSLQLKNINFSSEIILQNIELLLSENLRANGNIRIELYVSDHSLDLFSYYIEHHYPSDVEYAEGVRLVSFIAERKHPNAKIVHQQIKENINEILTDKDIYEVLLVNPDGGITEGSRSNVFFVKGKEVFTAPGEMVLKGITRKYVIEAMSLIGISIIESKIGIEEIGGFDAVFLSGTSPMVLPVKQINEYQYKVKNDIISSILIKYRQLINDYIKVRK